MGERGVLAEDIDVAQRGGEGQLLAGRLEQRRSAQLQLGQTSVRRAGHTEKGLNARQQTEDGSHAVVDERTTGQGSSSSQLAFSHSPLPACQAAEVLVRAGWLDDAGPNLRGETNVSLSVRFPSVASLCSTRPTTTLSRPHSCSSTDPHPTMVSPASRRCCSASSWSA